MHLRTSKVIYQFAGVIYFVRRRRTRLPRNFINQARQLSRGICSIAVIIVRTTNGAVLERLQVRDLLENVSKSEQLSHQREDFECFVLDLRIFHLQTFCDVSY